MQIDGRFVILALFFTETVVNLFPQLLLAQYQSTNHTNDSPQAGQKKRESFVPLFIFDGLEYKFFSLS